jgi:hypothetical protein
MDLGADGSGRVEAEGLLERRAEPVRVIAQATCAGSVEQQIGTEAVVAGQYERLLQQGDRLVDLIAADGERGRAAQPPDSAIAQLGRACLLVGPCEVGDGRRRRLGVVVREQRRVRLGVGAGALEPLADARV